MTETQAQRVFRLLRSSIATGTLSPGSSISEAELARQFNVSRTPIREATLRLEQEGVLTRAAGRLVVAALSYEAAANLYTTRAALEGMCAYLATLAASPSKLDALAEIVDRSREALEARDLDGVVNDNAAFHRAIEDLAANRLLSETLRRIELWTQRYQRAAVVSFGRAEDSLADHRLIVAVMRTGDPVRAERAMKTHILNAGRSFLEAMRVFHGDATTSPASMALEGFEGRLDDLLAPLVTSNEKLS